MIKSVSIILFDDMLASSACLPLEMLHSADNIAQRMSPRRERMNIQTVAATKTTIRTQAGLQLAADQLIDKATKPDLLLIPTFWRNPLRGLRRNLALLAWLRDIERQGTQLCAVSTGSYLLAEAGLLKDRAATTHWFYFDAFAHRYPNIKLQRQHMITKADQIYCAGSINALADLMIYFINEHFGERVAKQVESQFSPEIRRTYRETLYIEGSDSLHHDETVALAQDYINANSHQPINMAQLAADHQIAPRTMNRRFKAVSGSSPGLYLLQRRLDNARELLSKSNLSIAEIAEAVGFKDSSYFIKQFKRHTAVTPLRYRQSVRGKLFRAP